MVFLYKSYDCLYKKNMFVAARAARRPLYVFSLCFVLFVFAFLFFVCAARDLCHNGTCVAWDPGARAPGPGGLGGWKPPREYHLGSQTRQKVPTSLVFSELLAYAALFPAAGAFFSTFWHFLDF